MWFQSITINYGARPIVPYWIDTVWIVRQKLSPDDLFPGLICSRILLFPLSISSPLKISLLPGNHTVMGLILSKMTHVSLMVPIKLLQYQWVSCGTHETPIISMTILWYIWHLHCTIDYPHWQLVPIFLQKHWLPYGTNDYLMIPLSLLWNQWLYYGSNDSLSLMVPVSTYRTTYDILMSPLTNYSLKVQKNLLWYPQTLMVSTTLIC